MVHSQTTLSLRQDVTFFKRAHRLTTPYFVVFWEVLPSGNESLVSIIVPKHHLKTSVKRHRVKRQLRAAIQRHSSLLPQPYRLVLSANRACSTLTPNVLNQVIADVLGKIVSSKN